MPGIVIFVGGPCSGETQVISDPSHEFYARRVPQPIPPMDEARPADTPYYDEIVYQVAARIDHMHSDMNYHLAVPRDIEPKRLIPEITEALALKRQVEQGETQALADALRQAQRGAAGMPPDSHHHRREQAAQESERAYEKFVDSMQNDDRRPDIQHVWIYETYTPSGPTSETLPDIDITQPVDDQPLKLGQS